MFNLMDTLDQWSITACIVSYNKGQIIYQSSDKAKGLDYILKGQAVIQHINEEGQLISLACFNTHDSMGGNRVFASNPCFPMTITAKSDMVICRLSQNHILDLCQKDLAFLKWFLKELADKSDHLSASIKSLSFMTIKDRILQYLYENIDGSGHLTLPFTKTEWAQQMGVSRSSLSRSLQKLKQDKIINFTNRGIQLIDPNI